MTAENHQGESQQATNLEAPLELKEELLAVWTQLPTEHQASTALVQLDAAREIEWRTWLKESIEPSRLAEVLKIGEPFPVVSVNPRDMKPTGLSDEEINQPGGRGLQMLATTWLASCVSLVRRARPLSKERFSESLFFHPWNQVSKIDKPILSVLSYSKLFMGGYDR